MKQIKLLQNNHWVVQSVSTLGPRQQKDPASSFWAKNFLIILERIPFRIFTAMVGRQEKNGSLELMATSLDRELILRLDTRQPTDLIRGHVNIFLFHYTHTQGLIKGEKFCFRNLYFYFWHGDSTWSQLTHFPSQPKK